MQTAPHLERYMRASLLGAVVLAASAAHVAAAREYDAERDLGLVADDATNTVAERNTATLSAALESQWSGGKFKFADGHIGPVLYPIRCAAKEFFFAGTITSARRMGGILVGGGGRSYLITSHDYGPSGQFGGAVTRFTRIDGEKGGPMLRLRGTGFVLDGISFQGRRTPGTAGFTTVGTKSECCIEVEGRNAIATGLHTIRNCTIAECNYGIRAIAGYYGAGGKFVQEEAHADQGVVENVSFWGVASCFRSENQQAVFWSFQNIYVNQNASDNQTVVFDIARGGNVRADCVMLNHRKVTLFKVRDFSPNSRRLVCDNFKIDAGFAPGAYLTLFKYDGPVYAGQDMSWIKWSVRVTGHIPTFGDSLNKNKLDGAKLIQIPDRTSGAGIDRDDLLFDIAGLPGEGFESVGDAWMRPK